MLPGLAVGDTGLIPASLRAEFRTTGLAHLLAVSGSNVVIVCGAVLGLLRLAVPGRGSRRPVRARPCSGTWCSPARRRACCGPAVMGAVALLAMASGRSRSAVPALARGGDRCCCWSTRRWAPTPGSRCPCWRPRRSCCSHPAGPRALRRRGVPPGVAEALAVPAAAHWSRAPVVAGLSGRSSLVAVAANLLVTPVVAPATVLGVLATVVSPVAPWAAEFLARLAGPECSGWSGRRGRPPGCPARRCRGHGLLGGLLLVAVTLLLRRVAAASGGSAPGGRRAGRPADRVLPDPVGAAGLAGAGLGDGGLRRRAGRRGRAGHRGRGPRGAGRRGPGPQRRSTAAWAGSASGAVALVVLSHLHADHVGGLDGALAAARSARSPSGRHGARPGRCARWRGGGRAPGAGGGAAPGPAAALARARLEVIGPRTCRARSTTQDGTAVNDTSVIIRAATSAGFDAAHRRCGAGRAGRPARPPGSTCAPTS